MPKYAKDIFCDVDDEYDADGSARVSMPSLVAYLFPLRHNGAVGKRRRARDLLRRNARIRQRRGKFVLSISKSAARVAPRIIDAPTDRASWVLRAINTREKEEAARVMATMMVVISRDL